MTSDNDGTIELLPYDATEDAGVEAVPYLPDGESDVLPLTDVDGDGDYDYQPSDEGETTADFDGDSDIVEI